VCSVFCGSARPATCFLGYICTDPRPQATPTSTASPAAHLTAGTLRPSTRLRLGPPSRCH
jgi:hypothetical protein